MSALIVAQYMAAAAFFMMALMHLLVWLRNSTVAKTSLLFALAVLAAGLNALFAGWCYQATTVGVLIPALKAYVTSGLLWLMALTWFMAAYTGLGTARRRWAAGLSMLLISLSVVNVWMPASLLYTEIVGLQNLTLPWGERITVVVGRSSFWRLPVELANLGILVLIALGCRQLYRQGERRRAWLFGSSLLLFMLLFDYHDLLVDLGLLRPPYLSAYGFLVIALGMSYDLISKVTTDERRWLTLPEEVHLLIVGVNRAGCVSYVNPCFAVVSGYTAAEVIGRPFSQFLPAREQIRLQQAFENLLAGNSTPEPFTEAVISIKSGEGRIIHWSNVALRNAYGEITSTLSIGIDITEQRQAEAARDAAMRQLRHTLQELQEAKARLEEHVVYLQQEIKTYHNFDEIIGRSEALKAVLEKIEQVAPSTTTVLIEGETGVGKELVARAIHRLSPRHDRPLVKVNCATLPPNLIEAEMFGYERGAFTGASRLHKGYCEMADGGTLFLDEIGELPLELQSKLLCILQSGELERLGGNRPIHVDIRIIAATNRNLRKEVKQGRFRKDLYYRLNVFPITVPPLRHRKEDIPLLVNVLVNQFTRALGKRIDRVPEAVMEQLLQYDWPGNIRELENIIKQAVIATSDDQLRLEVPLTDQLSTAPPVTRHGTLEQIERNYIVYTLNHCDWHIEGERGAATRLGLNPSTLRSRIRKLGIKRFSPEL